MTVENKEYGRMKESARRILDDLRVLWTDWLEGGEGTYDLGSFNEYGLSFDYVAPGTYTDQNRGYFRYQISWGGPAEQFEIYADKGRGGRWYIWQIEFHLLDWGSDSGFTLSGDDLELMTEIVENYFDLDYAYDQAMGE